MAGRSIANLAASVTANTSGFTKGLKKAAGEVGGFAKSVAKAGAAIGAAATAGFGVWFNSISKLIDEQTKMAKRMGLSSEEFQTFRLAAERGGTEVESFAQAMKTLSEKTFQSLHADSKEATRLFDRLGISTQKLGTLSKDNIGLFTTVANAIGKIKNETERAAIGTQLLGENYLKLIPALEEGNLEKASKDASKFGLALSEKATKAVEAFRDELSDVGERFTGLSSQIVGNLAGAAQELVRSFGEWLDQLALSEGGVENLGRKIAASFVQGAKVAVESVASITNAVIDVINWVRELNHDLTKAAKAVGVFSQRGDVARTPGGQLLPAEERAEIARELQGPERLGRVDISAITKKLDDLAKTVEETGAANVREFGNTQAERQARAGEKSAEHLEEAAKVLVRVGNEFKFVRPGQDPNAVTTGLL